MTKEKLKTESHKGRPIEFSFDENGLLGIEFDDYPCSYRYMSEAKARELRDWLNRAFPDEPEAPPAETSAAGSFTELVWQPQAESDELTVKFPRAWAPYLQAVILGALDDFDNQGDCRWHLNELAKFLGRAALNREAPQK